MALEIYQELIPFTNEKAKYPVSANSAYTNPVVMPLSFDVTSSVNTVETVMYLRNNNKDQYYQNVCVMLMAPRSEFNSESVRTSSYTIDSVTVSSGTSTLKITSSGSPRHYVDLDYSTETHPVGNITFNQNTWFDGSGNTMLPIGSYTSSGSDYSLSPLLSKISDVRFSYGYDEISELDWTTKKHAILIPSIGNSSMPDNSYIPIRMRIYLNGNGSLYTLRNYSINVCYSTLGTVQ